MELQTNIFGENKITGSIKAQLGVVFNSDCPRNPKDLLYKWAEVQHRLPTQVVDCIIQADRVSRTFFENPEIY